MAIGLFQQSNQVQEAHKIQQAVNSFAKVLSQGLDAVANNRNISTHTFGDEQKNNAVSLDLSFK